MAWQAMPRLYPFSKRGEPLGILVRSDGKCIPSTFHFLYPPQMEKRFLGLIRTTGGRTRLAANRSCSYGRGVNHMLQFPYFQQECPICGRPLRVRVEHVGKRVSCGHCMGKFVAVNQVAVSQSTKDQNGDSYLGRLGPAPRNRSERLLQRADELLQLSGSGSDFSAACG